MSDLKPAKRMTYWRGFVFPHVRHDPRNPHLDHDGVCEWVSKWLKDADMPMDMVTFEVRKGKGIGGGSLTRVRKHGDMTVMVSDQKEEKTGDVAAFLAGKAIEGYHGLRTKGTGFGVSPFYLAAVSIMLRDFGFDTTVLQQAMTDSKLSPFPYTGELKGLIAVHKLLEEFEEN